MRPLIPGGGWSTSKMTDARSLNDLILNSALLRFKQSRLRMKGQIVSPMAGQVVAVIKDWNLLGFKTESGAVYWWRLGLIWPNCPVVPFELMVKVGDHVEAGQPLAIMVNAWGQPRLVVMRIATKIERALVLIQAELSTSLRLIHHVEQPLARSVINLAGNHQVKIMSPPRTASLVRAFA